jgi:hypothetical protein
MMLKKILGALAFGVTLFALTGNSSARVLMVYPDGSGAYPVIQEAIDSSANGDTVMLADGTFVGMGNMDIYFRGKSIVVCSQSGNANACIIDVRGRVNEAAERGFIFENGEDSTSVLKDLTVINGSADGPCPACEGGGIYVHFSSPKIINVVSRNNYAASGSGIMVVHGSPIIRNCRFVSNDAIDAGGLGCIDSANVIMENCLLSGNNCTLRGGGASLQSNCTLTLINCTITNNSAVQGAGVASWESDYVIKNTIISYNTVGASIYIYGQADFAIRYSDIFGNAGGDWVDSIAGQFGINGNISANPLYADTAAGDFRLAPGSPCIDTGDPSSPHNPDGSRADMGAFCFNHFNAVDDDISMPVNISVEQNYPNPFNASTVIEYALGEPANVTLEIYDILGRELTRMDIGIQPSGRHQATWDSGGNPSGIYFYRLRADNNVTINRMVLLK